MTTTTTALLLAALWAMIAAAAGCLALVAVVLGSPFAYPAILATIAYVGAGVVRDTWHNHPVGSA